VYPKATASLPSAISVRERPNVGGRKISFIITDPCAGGILKQVKDSPILLKSIASRQKWEKPLLISICEIEKFPY
jgi:hypothetical protein